MPNELAPGATEREHGRHVTTFESGSDRGVVERGPRAGSTSGFATLALFAGIAIVVTLNLSQVLIATHGDPVGVRVVVAVFIVSCGALAVASARLRTPAFVVALGMTLLVLIVAGFITLSAGTN